MSGVEVLVGVVIAVGIVGVVVPMLPGSLFIVGAVLVWALEIGSATAWSVLAVVVTLVLAGAVVKYVVPGRRLARAGVPPSTLLAGTALGVVGFFVVPVVGLFLGFVLGVYLTELGRVGRAAAWPATRAGPDRRGPVGAHRADRGDARRGRLGGGRGADVSPA